MLFAIGASIYLAVGLLMWKKQLVAINETQARLENGEPVTEEEENALNQVGEVVSIFGYQTFVLLTYIAHALFWLPFKVKNLIGGKK